MDAATSQRSLSAKNINGPHDFRLTIWLFNVAMENGPFIDGLPIKMVIFHGYVK